MVVIVPGLDFDYTNGFQFSLARSAKERRLKYLLFIKLSILSCEIRNSFHNGDVNETPTTFNSLLRDQVMEKIFLEIVITGNFQFSLARSGDGKATDWEAIPI